MTDRPDTPILPTTMVGSYPRPEWYTQQLHGRALMDHFKVAKNREAYEDATSVVIHEQVRAGLDIVTDGQMYYDDYAGAIGSMLWYWYERIPGFDPSRRPNPAQYAESADWTERETLRVGGATRTVSQIGPLPGSSGLVEMFEVAQSVSPRPVKYSVGALATNLGFHVDYNAPGSAYSNIRALAEDLAPVFNTELKQLVAAGCTYIQIEDLSPWLLLQGPEYGWVFDILNATIAGVDAYIAWHCCLGAAYGNSVRAWYGQLERIIDGMFTVDVNEYALDFSQRGMADIGVLRGLPAGKNVAVGVIDVRTLQIESIEEVAERMRTALEVVDPSRVAFTTDCGMKALPRFCAHGKLRALAAAAAEVRQEVSSSVVATP